MDKDNLMLIQHAMKSCDKKSSTKAQNQTFLVEVKAHWSPAESYMLQYLITMTVRIITKN